MEYYVYICTWAVRLGGGGGAASTCVAWCGKEGGETGGGTAADMFSAVALG